MNERKLDELELEAEVYVELLWQRFQLLWAGSRATRIEEAEMPAEPMTPEEETQFEETLGEVTNA